MIPKTMRSFVSRLRDVTDEGKVTWTEGAEGVYFCNHNSFELYINHRLDSESEQSSFFLKIKSGERKAFITVEDHEDDYTEMKNFYEAASVNAAGFEDIEEEFFRP